MSFSYSNTQFNMLLFGSQERMSEKIIEKASFLRIFKHFLFLCTHSLQDPYVLYVIIMNF